MTSDINDHSQVKNEMISESKYKDPKEEKWAYFELYPERRKHNESKSFWKSILSLDGSDQRSLLKCERNVYSCLRNSPLVKVLLGALRNSGCEFDYRRHVSCEVCGPQVSGGFDPEMNQVVICQNIARSQDQVQSVMIHEMIHMFDYCRYELDFRNLHHIACLEIRAANLAHCSFMASYYYGQSSLLNLKKTHRECVKMKALSSIMAVKGVQKEEAVRAVDEVFDKCYNDLEPIGRRIRRGSIDMEQALIEAPFYGYDYSI